MALSTTKITLKQIRDTLGETSLALTELCSSTKINEWSPYKPINNSEVPRATATRDYISGFRVINNYLEYDRPTGTSNSPYCQGDFRGYNHYARRPSVENFNKVVLDNNTDFVQSGNVSVVVNITNPDQECFAKVLNENMPTLTPTISIYEVVGGIENFIVSGLPITNGVDGITRVSFTAQFSFTQMPPSGTILTKTYNIWYGDAGQTKTFRIHGADTFTVTVKVISAYPKVQVSLETSDFLAIGSVNPITNYSYDYNMNTKTLVINNLQITGLTKGPAEFQYIDGHTYSVDYRGLDYNTNVFSTQVRYSYGQTGNSFDTMANLPRGFTTSVEAYVPGKTWTLTIGTPITLTNISSDYIVYIKIRRDPNAPINHLLIS
ncbi:MAG: hypothetical protein EOM35_07585 [Negativicutes bacterium]|nr:hypothetical protein [Negativicutes bacterium]